MTWVFIGGGLGCLCRYGLSILIKDFELPFATLSSNVISCIILGLLIGFNSKSLLSDPTKLFLMTGFCGGFSTFSTFSGELVLMIQSNQWKLAVFYTCLKLVAGVLSIFSGIYISRFFL